MPTLSAPQKAPLSMASLASWWSDATHNRIVALVLALIIVVPMVATPVSSRFSGAASLTLEVSAIALLTMLLWRARFDFSSDSLRQFFSTGANTPILLLLALTGTSCFFSPFPTFSVQQLLTVGAGALLYFVVGYKFRQRKHLSLLVSTLMFLCGTVAFSGLAFYQLNGENRAAGFFSNPQPMASLLMLLLPLMVALAFGDKSPQRARVAQFVTVLMVGALLATQVRTAWAGSLAGLVTLAFLMSRPLVGASHKRVAFATRKHTLVWPTMFACIAVGFALMISTHNTSIQQRTATLAGLGSDSSWNARLHQLWPAAWQMFKAHPLTGVGAGLFPVYQGQITHQGAILQGNQLSTGISMYDQAHNFYLQTAAELGAPGLILTLVVFVTFLTAGFKRLSTLDTGTRRTLLMGSLAATIGFMVDACASPSWQYSQISMFLWLMMGMGTSCLRPRLKTHTSEEESVVPIRRTVCFSRPATVALALALITLLPASPASACTGYTGSCDSGGGTSTGEKVVIGTGVVAATYYLVTEVFFPPSAPPATPPADVTVTTPPPA